MTTIDVRRAAFEETHRVATEDTEKRLRKAREKTERLRALRLQREAESSHEHDNQNLD